MDPITVAYSPFETTGLVWIAQDRHFFESNLIRIIPRKYNTGVDALNAVIDGEADIVIGTTEFPIVAKAFQKTNIDIIGSIAKSEIIYIIGRKDRGIDKPSDLKGKLVGTTIGTISEFYLGRFLELNGMTMADIKLVNLKTPAEWVDAVVNGDIDAVATAQPYASSAQELLGSNAVFWSAQGGQLLYSNAIATDEWITDNTELVNRFLKSLILAEEYFIRNPSEAEALIQKQLQLDETYMEMVCIQNQFELSLEQSLILAMEDEARWMIANKLTSEKQIPNFLDYIYEDELKAIKPEAVNIIR
ncbi:MAG: ABC transporter substrate-binding protein [Candidatus Humimicrobiaceae bacterium]